MNAIEKRPLLSVVIPAFNEEERLPATLLRVAEFAAGQSYAVEVIVVDNASTDGTGGIVKDFILLNPFFRLMREERRGKGAAVRRGMLAATGEYILICDADLAVPIEEADTMLTFLRDSGYDIAIGSREAAGARRFNEPPYRHLMGRVFNLIVRGLLLPGIKDSQCGFKCFRRQAAADLFGPGSIDGWGFDAEILYISRLRGYRFIEVPVKWYYGEKSKVNPLRDPWRMLQDVLRVRANRWRGKYGRNKSSSVRHGS
jgi:dolichyl-phosphate beta-glucosyltransferase